MNMHISTISDRSLLPRGLIARRPAPAAGYRFEVGDIVEHVNGGLASVVTGRSLSAMGREIYDVTELADPSRPRTFQGHVLTRISTDTAIRREDHEDLSETPIAATPVPATEGKMLLLRPLRVPDIGLQAAEAA
jgi:hypothetical protein